MRSPPSLSSSLEDPPDPDSVFRKINAGEPRFPELSRIFSRAAKPGSVPVRQGVSRSCV